MSVNFIRSLLKVFSFFLQSELPGFPGSSFYKIVAK